MRELRGRSSRGSSYLYGQPFIYDCCVYACSLQSRYRASIINAVSRGFGPRTASACEAEPIRRVMRRIIYSCQLSADGQLPPIKMSRIINDDAGRRQGVSTNTLSQQRQVIPCTYCITDEQQRNRQLVNSNVDPIRYICCFIQNITI